MPSYGRSNTPVKATDFLRARLAAAKGYVAALTKTSYPSVSESVVATQIIHQYKLEPLKLGSSKASIAADVDVPANEIPRGQEYNLYGHNYRDVTTVTWPVSGSPELVGLVDPQGNVLEIALQRGALLEKHVTNTGVGTNMHLQEVLKKNIASSTTSYQAHFDLLNAAVASFHKQLEDEIPTLVSAKLKSLNSIKSAEDFLNS